MGGRLLKKHRLPALEEVKVSCETGVFRASVIRRANVKGMKLRVSHATGEVRVTVPLYCDSDTACRFLEGHSGWVAECLTQIPQRIPFAAHSNIPLRDIPHQITHDARASQRARSMIDEAGSHVISVGGDALHIARRIRHFLQEEARKDLSLAVSKHAQALDVDFRSIALRDTRSRWGSCSAQRRLNFSWRLILAPPFVLDYVAAHEVAHLREMNHSERFWRLTYQLCSDTDKAKAWLKAHGAHLHRYG